MDVVCTLWVLVLFAQYVLEIHLYRYVCQYLVPILLLSSIHLYGFTVINVFLLILLLINISLRFQFQVHKAAMHNLFFPAMRILIQGFQQTCFHFSLMYTQEKNCWPKRQMYVLLSQTLPDSFPKRLYQFMLSLAMLESSRCFTFSSMLGTVSLLILAILPAVLHLDIFFFICIVLAISRVSFFS